KAPAGLMVRYDAARLLAVSLRARAPDAVADHLLHMLQNRTLKGYRADGTLGPDARYMAAQALAYLGVKLKGRPGVIQALRQAAGETDAGLRKAALEALKSIGVSASKG